MAAPTTLIEYAFVSALLVMMQKIASSPWSRTHGAWGSCHAPDSDWPLTFSKTASTRSRRSALVNSTSGGMATPGVAFGADVSWTRHKGCATAPSLRRGESFPTRGLTCHRFILGGRACFLSDENYPVDGAR